MTLHADDLPDDVRARLGLPARKRKRPRPSRSEAGGDTPARCHACGVIFPTVGRAITHANRDHGGGRVELIVAGAP